MLNILKPLIFILLINVKMPTIVVCILTLMCRINFKLRCVELKLNLVFTFSISAGQVRAVGSMSNLEFRSSQV